ncbi:hypothetical protein [Litorivita pollutaquae]|uniref:hypothetical protein n=1 Tax=Litorivita pollutaquae TaxID=2200892 RepID=UPI0013A617E3|nr:hypothetical protein [Litorivita pollutaquae]
MSNTCTFFLSLVLAIPISSEASAAISCKRIGDDPYGIGETLFVDGPAGAYGYKAYNGQREILEVKCDTFKNDTDQTVLCASIFERADGTTTYHYIIPKVSHFTSMFISTFVENTSPTLYPNENQGRYKQIAVACSKNSD